MSNNVFLFVDDNRDNDEYVQMHGDGHVVKAWKPTMYLPLRLTRAAKSSGISLLHLQHEFNMYGGIKGVLTFLLLIKFLKLNKMQVVVTMHGVVDPKQVDRQFLKAFGMESYAFLMPVVKASFYFFYKMVGRLADSIIVHSAHTKQVYMEGYGLPGRKCTVIAIGIDRRSDSIRNEICEISVLPWYEKIRHARIILYFGYIVRRKGLEVLLGAYARVRDCIPDHVLVLAGGCLDRQEGYVDELKGAVATMGLRDKVVFTGFISEKDIQYLYGKCDCVVLPYAYSISSSLPLSLALGAGKPVIASDVGTLRDEIIESKTGVFFENGNADDLAEKIRVLCTDKDLLEVLRAGSREEAQKRTWERVAETTMLEYDRVGRV